MILVTGGTGFVGAHLLYFLLQKKEKVRAIYRSAEKIENVKEVFTFYTNNAKSLLDSVEWFKADITEIPSMTLAFEGIERVYHCAAIVSFNSKDFYKMQQANIEGTTIIANLSIAQKIKKICYVSSIAAVGNAIKNKPITENNEWNKDNDNSAYSITKFGAEMEIWRATQEGVPAVIVNPGVILGSGYWHTGSGKLFSKIYNGFNFYTKGRTGFVGVQDVVKVMIHLMDSTIKNERFILVSENKSFKEILDAIADVLQKKQPSVFIKKWQSALLWRVSEFISFFTRKSPFLNKYAAKSAHNISSYSAKKIENKINFKFTPINDVIEATGNNFLKNKV